MKIKNPYFQFTFEQKRKFAQHLRDSNGRFLPVRNEEILSLVNTIIRKEKLTQKAWKQHATTNKFPQNIKCILKRTSTESWSEFVKLCNDFNHKIADIEILDDMFECYDLQVEENNKYNKKFPNRNNIEKLWGCPEVTSENRKWKNCRFLF